MHDCIKKLLDAEDEDSLELLCNLLKTIGKELDTDKAKVCLGYVDINLKIQFKNIWFRYCQILILCI